MIRKACPEDLDRILEVYACARAFMVKAGNPNQWGDSHPPKATLEDDIKKGNLYVILRDDVIRGVYAFIAGEDKTYGYIEDGSWINDAPYCTIHRIASDGREKGILAECVAYCRQICDNIRIDTHHDNKPMQNAIAKENFVKCGVIYVEDGSPRIAYQWVK